jgi:hypothetical protein
MRTFKTRRVSEYPRLLITERSDKPKYCYVRADLDMPPDPSEWLPKSKTEEAWEQQGEELDQLSDAEFRANPLVKKWEKEWHENLEKYSRGDWQKTLSEKGYGEYEELLRRYKDKINMRTTRRLLKWMREDWGLEDTERGHLPAGFPYNELECDIEKQYAQQYADELLVLLKDPDNTQSYNESRERLAALER